MKAQPREIVKAVTGAVALLLAAGLFLESASKSANAGYLLVLLATGGTWLQMYVADRAKVRSTRVQRTFGVTEGELKAMYHLSENEITALLDDRLALAAFTGQLNKALSELDVPEPPAACIRMDSFDNVLECDDFVNYLCVKCGAKEALFATPRMFSACPSCLSERIRLLREAGGTLPEWLFYLEKAGEREAVRQRKAEEASLSVSFDDFFRCARCDRLIQRQDARYYVPPGSHSSPPYCVPCYEGLRSP